MPRAWRTIPIRYVALTSCAALPIKLRRRQGRKKQEPTTSQTQSKQQQENPTRMSSSIVLYLRMMIELLIALFITGLLAALCGGAAYGLAHLAHFAN